MKRKWRESRILKDIVARKLFIKKELQLIFWKSILQNKNTKPINRSFYKLKLLVTLKKKSCISHHQNRCILSGKAKSTLNFSSFSRQFTKKYVELGLLQNIRTFN